MVLKSPFPLVQNSLEFVISSHSLRNLSVVSKADMARDLSTVTADFLDVNTKLTWVITQ